MRISWIKTSNDNNSFKVFENLGFDVYRLNEPDETDTKIEELIKNDCKTIILSNEIAAFSEDIITKYKNNDDVSIIIASNKNNEKDWMYKLISIAQKVSKVYISCIEKKMSNGDIFCKAKVSPLTSFFVYNY